MVFGLQRIIACHVVTLSQIQIVVGCGFGYRCHRCFQAGVGWLAGLQHTGGRLAGNQLNAVLERLHMLAQRRGIRVAFLTALHLAHIRLFHGVRARVLEPIRGIRIGLQAALKMALVGLLAGVRTDVYFQVLGTRKGLLAQMATVRLLLGVGAHMDQHLVARIEAPIAALTAAPAAVVEPVVQRGDGVT